MKFVFNKSAHFIRNYFTTINYFQKYHLCTNSKPCSIRTFTNF